ncbi:MAG: bifunctional demethylmenaquinone methyltransferase/2-methoxy-6-polyprenyl-1,4-benzoquinol methylase UbiE [Pseudomonadota bacterium]
MSDSHFFGFQEVDADEKTQKVKEVFDSVAGRYDLMNDLMSLGLHRIWKAHALNELGLRPNMKVLDLAAGTGDLSVGIQRRLRGRGEIVSSDINLSMLAIARDRLINRGIAQTRCVQSDAQALAFADCFFDRAVIAFGLRNVTEKSNALREALRVLKPGGKLVILEFSKLQAKSLERLYDFYSLQALPMLGKVVAKDAQSYRYLAESIRMHPDQQALSFLMKRAGFSHIKFRNLGAGIVAIHSGFRL